MSHKSLKDILDERKNDQMATIESYFVKAPYCTQSTQLLLKELEHCKVHKFHNVPYDFYEQEELNVRNQFFVRIYEGKVNWNPQKGKLRNFVQTVIFNLWMDEIKKETKTQHENIDYHLNEDFLVEKQEVKEEMQKDVDLIQQQIIRRSCYHRVVIKMWIPTVFSFTFLPIEMEWLEQNCVLSMTQIKQKLEQEIHKNSQNNKPNIVSPNIIAEILQENRNIVDKIISRFRKQLMEAKVYKEETI